MAGVALLAMTGCRKDPVNGLSEQEARIYVTHKDPNANFATYRTFTTANQVMLVQNNSSRQQLTGADQALITAFANALQQKRFSRVDQNANPDLGVQISRIIQTSTGVMTIGDYWDYWDPYWGGGFGGNWGFGQPMWGTVTYQVQEGMLAIDIIDLKNRGTNNNVRVLWNGLVRGPGLESVNSVNDIVQNLLNQSPYLQTN
jgi:hypothetical protein